MELEQSRAEPDTVRLARLVAGLDDTDQSALDLEHRIADLAEALAAAIDPARRLETFRSLPASLRAEVLEELEPACRDELLEASDDTELLELLQVAQIDDAVYFLDHIPEERGARLLQLMTDAERSRLLSEQWDLPEDCAGHIMSIDLATVHPSLTVGRIRERMRRTGQRIDGYLYVVDRHHRLLGYIALKDLLIAEETQRADAIMSDQQVQVELHKDRELVADLMQRYHLRAVPVVDEAGRLRGEVTWDDAVDVLEAEVHEDLMAIAGTSEDPEENAGALRRARQRLPYLVVTAIGGFIMAKLIHDRTGDLMARVPILLAFLPLVPALGGNIGIQSATVTVRAMAAAGKGGNDRQWRRTLRELATGTLLAICLSLLCGAGALGLVLWTGGQAVIGAIIAISLLVAILIAAAFGVFIPMACQRLRIDPAIAAGPFITMLNDITGVGIYLVVATLLIDALPVL